MLVSLEQTYYLMKSRKLLPAHITQRLRVLSAGIPGDSQHCHWIWVTGQMHRHDSSVALRVGGWSGLNHPSWGHRFLLGGLPTTPGTESRAGHDLESQRCVWTLRHHRLHEEKPDAVAQNLRGSLQCLSPTRHILDVATWEWAEVLKTAHDVLEEIAHQSVSFAPSSFICYHQCQGLPGLTKWVRGIAEHRPTAWVRAGCTAVLFPHLWNKKAPHLLSGRNLSYQQHSLDRGEFLLKIPEVWLSVCLVCPTPSTTQPWVPSRYNT